MIEHFLYRYMANTAAMETAGIEEVTKVATEAISNIRTVASLRKYIKQYIYILRFHQFGATFSGQEPHIFTRYCTEISRLEKTILKKMSLRGLVNSTGQSIPFFGYALALYYGGMMVANEGVHFKNIIK